MSSAGNDVSGESNRMETQQKSPLLSNKKKKRRRPGSSSLSYRPKKKKKDQSKTRHDLLSRKEEPLPDANATDTRTQSAAGNSNNEASPAAGDGSNDGSNDGGNDGCNVGTNDCINDRDDDDRSAPRGDGHDDGGAGDICLQNFQEDNDSDYEIDSDSDSSTEGKKKRAIRRPSTKKPPTKSDAVAVVDPKIAAKKERQVVLRNLDYLEREHSGNLLAGEQSCPSTRSDKLGRRIFDKEAMRQRRVAIHYFFTQIYQSPDESTGAWGGRKGVVVRIRDALMLKKGRGPLRTITSTLRVIKIYQQKNAVYRGEREPRNSWNRYLIKHTDFEAQLMADMIEGGLGFTETCDKVNEWRRSKGLFEVGRSCIYNTNKRLKPVVTAIKKKQQGSTDIDSEWCKASYRWATQMLLTLGELRQDAVPSLFLIDIENPIKGFPDCFALDKLEMHDIRCTAFFDESHKKQRSGNIRCGCNVEFRYPRNDEGGIDPENGKVRERGSETKMKYEKEARFCLGMCLQLDANGDIVTDEQGRELGMVLPQFEYTEQKIVSNQEECDMFIQVMKAPRKAKARAPWCVNQRKKGVICKGDPCTNLPKIGGKANEWLLNRQDPIDTVEKFYEWFHNRVDGRRVMVKAVKGLSMEGLLIAEAAAEKAEDGPPDMLDHRKENNPWKSRFPEDEYGKGYWKQMIYETSTMKKVVNIRKLVEHIIKVCEERYKGTRYEHTWCFYHDALSLMVSDKCIEWMRTMGYLKRWYLPQHQLNEMFSHYQGEGKMVGNHAGAMPWDESCNWDHDVIVLRHVAATFQLSEDDPKKFSLRTPKKVSYAYSRIYNCPTVERDGVKLLPDGFCGIPAHRLGHDIMKVKRYWKQVFDNKGLNQATTTKGHRGEELKALAKEGKHDNNWGGPRTKGAGKKPPRWHHPDAREAMDNFFKKSWETWQNNMKAAVEENGEMSVPRDDIGRMGLDPSLVEVEEITYDNKQEEEKEEEKEKDFDEEEFSEQEMMLKVMEDPDARTTSTATRTGSTRTNIEFESNESNQQ